LGDAPLGLAASRLTSYFLAYPALFVIFDQNAWQAKARFSAE
jgi:hypothetical protein